MFIEIPVQSVSPSPLSPSPCRERQGGLFDMLSRRFGRRSHDELCFHNHSEEDSRSSSTDSCSSTSGRIAVTSKTKIHNSNSELNCSTSDSSSNDSNDNAMTGFRHSIHRRSSSSIRRALQNLSLFSRSSRSSRSCSSTPIRDQKVKKNKKITPPHDIRESIDNQPPKRILRQPITYTYVKGISGLPKRVPRSSVCCHYTHR